MSADPPETPYDWDREPDDDWSRQLLVLVVAGTAAVILVLVVMTFLNGCAKAERPPVTLPTIPPPLTLPAPPDHITVATTTSTIPAA